MRIQFCTWAKNKLEDDSAFFQFVLWSDEATFKSDGTINRHNLHYWSEVNPYWMRTVDHRWSINVWAGIIGVRLIEPLFFEESLTTERCVRFLSEDFPNLVEDIPLRDKAGMWLQLDDASPHFWNKYETRAQ